MTTSETSLIVFENLNQYIEHKILPPASLPEMQKQYTKIVNARSKESQTAEQLKIDEIASLWAGIMAWWNKDFNYPKERDSKNSIVIPGLLLKIKPEFQRIVNKKGGSTPSLDVSNKGASGVASSETLTSARIAIQPWDPNTPYIALLKQADSTDRYEVYLKQKEKFGRSPVFYFDCAEFFLANDNKDLATRILTNLAELGFENPLLLRVLAHRLSQIDELDLAVGLFEEVLKLRPEDAQSHRDLALVLARRCEQNMAHSSMTRQIKTDISRAMQLLTTVIQKNWNQIDHIELVALMELNRLIPIATKLEVQPPDIDKRLIAKLDLDLRIVLTWTVAGTDIDLIIVEPSVTKGGHFSGDVFYDGNGPEEYILHKGTSGEYKIYAGFYKDYKPELAGVATLQVEVFTDYGRENEKRRVITKRLKGEGHIVLIGGEHIVSIGSVTLDKKQ